MVVDVDDAIRAAACAYVQAALERSGGFVSRAELEEFSYGGHRLPLIARQRGIWKPSGFTSALSILTTYVSRPDLRPYDDELMGPDGFARYKWRGIEAMAYDNVALRVAMELRKPLIWFFGVAPGVFEAACPVWLVNEEPAKYQFVVAIDETLRDQWHRELISASPFDPVRRYAERVVRERLHQRLFRDRVLIAYGKQCALCRLRHPPLLDAAHIRSDSEGGEPIVPNGIAMCAIHHRAFDTLLLTVRPDYRVEIRDSVLHEDDGPTLQHALQGLHLEPITLPRHRAEKPSKDLLEERYERFRAAV